MLKNKRGMSAEMLIGIILTLAIALAIFLYMRNLGLKGTIDKEACHQSVLMRSVPIMGEQLRKTVKLECKTEKILINFNDEKLIRQRIANAIYDCWWMLGEGKLNFFSSSLTRKNYCIVCSTIEFSSNVKMKAVSGFHDYLATEKVPLKNVTYLQYLSNSASPEMVGAPEMINTNQKYAVMFSFFKGEYLTNLIAGGEVAIIGAKYGAIIGSFVPVPGGTIIGGLTGIVIGGVAGWIMQSKWKEFVLGSKEDYFASWYLVPYEPETFKQYGCTNIENIP